MVEYFDKYSSTSYITRALTFASRHPGLQIKILYDSSLYSSK